VPRGLLVVLFSILPLAEASPPDPMWVGSVYDGADLDDIVAAVISSERSRRKYCASAARPYRDRGQSCSAGGPSIASETFPPGGYRSRPSVLHALRRRVTAARVRLRLRKYSKSALKTTGQ